MRRLFYSDDDFGGMFRDKLQQHRVTPSNTVWARIETELNGRKSVGKKRALWLLLGLIISTVSTLYLYNQSTLNERLAAHSNSISNNLKTSALQQPTILHNNFTTPNITNAQSLNNFPVYSSFNILKTLKNIDQVLGQLDHTIVYEKMDSPLPLLNPHELPLESNEDLLYTEPSTSTAFNFIPQSSPPVELISKNENCSSGLYAALAYSYGNYWLLTNSFQNNPNVTASFSPMRQISIQVGNKLNKRWSLESGINYLQSQVNYRSLNQNKRMQTSMIVDNRIDLRFVQLPLAVRYNLTGDCNRTLEIKAGYALSKYVKGTTTLGDYAFEFASDEIKPFQHVVTAGLESGIKVSKLIGVRYGFDVTSNTAMLSTKNVERINDLYRPIPLTLSAHLGISINK